MYNERDARCRALYKMSKSTLVTVWKSGPGQFVIYTASPVTRWSKDEIINDILQHEYPR